MGWILVSTAGFWAAGCSSKGASETPPIAEVARNPLPISNVATSYQRQMPLPTSPQSISNAVAGVQPDHRINLQRNGMMIPQRTYPTPKPLPHDPKADEIISKMRTAAAEIKTYQARIDTTVDIGKKPSTMIMDVKYNRPRETFSMISSGVMNGRKFGSTAIDDGKNIYYYDERQNRYEKTPHGSDNLIEQMGDPRLRTLSGSAFKYVRKEHANGKQMIVLQALPPSVRPDSKPPTIFMYVDATNYRLLRIAVNSEIGNSETVIKNEIIDATIPDGVFQFKPPSGSKFLTDAEVGNNLHVRRPGYLGTR